MGKYNSSYGYGIRIDDIINYKDDAFSKLVKQQNLYNDLDLDEDATELDCKDAIEEYEGTAGEKGIGALLSAISYENGMDLVAITDCNGYQYLVIMQMFPWQYSKGMQNIDSNDVERYLSLLLSEITEDELDIKIWEIEENFG